jgi:hypothetical protein
MNCRFVCVGLRLVNWFLLFSLPDSWLLWLGVDLNAD